MMTEAINYGLFFIGVFIGYCSFQWMGTWQYRKILLMCANNGTCEKLPDGNFYYIVPENEYNDLARFYANADALINFEEQGK